MITLQGCTSSHTLSPLTTMYTSCIPATFKRKPGEGVGHDLTNQQVSSQFYHLFGFHPQGDPAGVSLTAPNDVYRVPEPTNRVPLGTPGHVCLVCPKPTLPGATW